MGVSEPALWIGIGFVGQALFSARFIVQWLASERAKRSLIPMAFWYFSLLGGRRAAVLRDPQARPGVHRRAGGGPVRVPAQSLPDPHLQQAEA